MLGVGRICPRPLMGWAFLQFDLAVSPSIPTNDFLHPSFLKKTILTLLKITFGLLHFKIFSKHTFSGTYFMNSGFTISKIYFAYGTLF